MFRGLLLLALVWPACARQPIEFPHSTHIAKGIECIDCHTGVDSRDAAGIPSVRKCMLCHRTMAKDKPGVQALRGYAEKHVEVPWVRVYGFSPDAHVRFQHAPHIWAKIACARCHGAVEKMTVAAPAVNHTMGSCLTCHRENKATTECIGCHF